MELKSGDLCFYRYGDDWREGEIAGVSGKKYLILRHTYYNGELHVDMSPYKSSRYNTVIRTTKWLLQVVYKKDLT